MKRIVRRGHLSWSQQRLFLHAFWRAEKSPPPDLVPTELEVGSDISTEQLRRALGALVERHEILRTTIEITDSGDVEQVVHEASDPAVLPLVTVGGWHDRAALPQMVEEQLADPEFALTAAQPWRAFVYRVTTGGKCLILAMEHVLTDAHGIGVLRDEVRALAEHPENGPREDGGTVLQQLDLVAWERSESGERTAERALTYIDRLVARAPQRLLPESRHGSEPQRCYTTAIRSSGLLDALDHVAARFQATRPVILLSTMIALLSARTDQTLCPVRSLWANRITPGANDFAGCIFQPAYMLIDAGGDPRFGELVRRVGNACLQGQAHGRYPYDRVQELVARKAFIRGVYVRFLFEMSFIGPSRRETPLPYEPAPAVSQRDIRNDHSRREYHDRGRNGNCSFRPRVDGETLELCLDVDTGTMASSDADLFLRATQEVLNHLASSDGPRIGELATLVGIEPVQHDAGWIQMNGCWIDSRALEEAILSHPEVGEAAVAIRSGPTDELVAFVSARSPGLTPFALHEHVLARLPHNPDLISPSWYVICQSPPSDLGSVTAWERQVVTAEGNGRETPFLPVANPEEEAVAAVMGAIHTHQGPPNMAHTYVQAGGRVMRIPSVIGGLRRRGYGGLVEADFYAPVTLRIIASRMRQVEEWTG